MPLPSSTQYSWHDSYPDCRILQVSWASLYDWARIAGSEVMEQRPGVANRKIVFGSKKSEERKKPSVKNREKSDAKKEDTQLKPKRKTKANNNEEGCTVPLPSWAVDFLNRSRQSKVQEEKLEKDFVVLSSESVPLLVESNCSPLTTFSLSIPVTQVEEVEGSLESFPRSALCQTEKADGSMVTLDPPDLVRMHFTESFIRVEVCEL